MSTDYQTPPSVMKSSSWDTVGSFPAGGTSSKQSWPTRKLNLKKVRVKISIASLLKGSWVSLGQTCPLCQATGKALFPEALPPEQGVTTCLRLRVIPHKRNRICSRMTCCRHFNQCFTTLAPYWHHLSCSWNWCPGYMPPIKSESLEVRPRPQGLFKFSRWSQCAATLDTKRLLATLK